MDYTSVTNTIAHVVTEQGKILRDAFLNPGVIKSQEKVTANWDSDLDVVTQLDTLVENAIYDALHVKFPYLGFVLEENFERNDNGKEFTCLIDPIDGTKHFAADIPLFSTSVGILYNDIPVAGVVYNPISEQLYIGAEGIPTTLNSRPVRVKNTPLLDKAFLSLDVSSHKENWETEQGWMNSKITLFNTQAQRVRLLGQGALSCAWVASGSLDAFISVWGHGSKPFDIAAGKALIKYAGGECKDIEIPGLPQPRFVGANAQLMAQIEEILLQD